MSNVQGTPLADLPSGPRKKNTYHITENLEDIESLFLSGSEKTKKSADSTLSSLDKISTHTKAEPAKGKETLLMKLTSFLLGLREIFNPFKAQKKPEISSPTNVVMNKINGVPGASKHLERHFSEVRNVNLEELLPEIKNAERNPAIEETDEFGTSEEKVSDFESAPMEKVSDLNAEAKSITPSVPAELEDSPSTKDIFSSLGIEYADATQTDISTDASKLEGVRETTRTTRKGPNKDIEPSDTAYGVYEDIDGIANQMVSESHKSKEAVQSKNLGEEQIYDAPWDSKPLQNALKNQIKTEHHKLPMKEQLVQEKSHEKPHIYAQVQRKTQAKQAQDITPLDPTPSATKSISNKEQVNVHGKATKAAPRKRSLEKSNAKQMSDSLSTTGSPASKRPDLRNENKEQSHKVKASKKVDKASAASPEHKRSNAGSSSVRSQGSLNEMRKALSREPSLQRSPGSLNEMRKALSREPSLQRSPGSLNEMRKALSREPSLQRSPGSLNEMRKAISSETSFISSNRNSEKFSELLKGSDVVTKLKSSGANKRLPSTNAGIHAKPNAPSSRSF